VDVGPVVDGATKCFATEAEMDEWVAVSPPAQGGGSWCPTDRSVAWSVEPTMYAGWNDRIPSVYLA
jgi:hypothetical protein